MADFGALLPRLGALVAAVCLTVLVGPFAMAESEGEVSRPDETKVLLIGTPPDHPPGTHLYLQECRILAECLRQLQGVEAVVSNGWPTDPEVLEGLDAIVVYSSPGADLLLGGDHGSVVEGLLDEGVGLVALHWATGCHGQEETEVGRRFLERMGGLFCFAYSGLNISESRVEQVDRGHPICRGWDDFTLTDEYYLNLKFLPEARPILKVSVEGKDQTVAWVYERPDSQGGRSCGNTLGHFHELFGREAFRRMLVNGILWAAHHEVPEDGAPCCLDEEAMEVE